MGHVSHLVIMFLSRWLESSVHMPLLSLNVNISEFCTFLLNEDSPLNTCRTVKLQSLSHLANSTVYAVLLLLVSQLVQKPGVCK